MSSKHAMLSLLGGPRLVGGPARRVIPFPAKGFALVAYLVLAAEDNISSRSALASFLWEDSDQTKASNNLRQLLARLRERQAVLGVTLLAMDGAHVRLEQKGVEIDLCRLLELVKDEEHSSTAELCRLYRGDLLEEYADSAPSLECWIRTERARLRSLFLEAVLGRIEGGAPEDPAAEPAARKIIQVDPYNERAWRALMRAAAAAGGREAAKIVFAECRHRLETELGVGPEAETEHLLAALDRGTAKTACSLGGSAFARSGQPPAQVPGCAEGRDRTDALLGLPRVCLAIPQGAEHDPLHLLAGALVEDVTVGLCRLKNLCVIAPHTAWRLGRDLDEACVRFGIDYLVTTRLSVLTGPPRLSVQLIATASREIAWAEQFPLAGETAAALHDDLSARIVHILAGTIERHELACHPAGPDQTAYQWYLTGQNHLRSLDLPAVRRARRAFRAAVAIAPDFAPALSGLARTMVEEWLLLARGDPDLLAEAEKLARATIEADPHDMRGYHEAGVVSLFQHRLAESEECLAKAEEFGPHYADLLADYADTLVHSGKAELARERIMGAMALNPLAPDHYFWTSGGIFFFLQLYENAIQEMMRMQDQTPAYRLLSACWAMLGEETLSRRYRDKALATYPDFSIEKWLSIIPWGAQDDRSHYAAALRRAGFA